jgi:outer membrane protein TolC
MNKGWSSCLSCLLLSVASHASAQEARPLTEREVVVVAVANNPTLHVALLRAQQSRFSLRAEEAFFVPIVSGNAGYTHSRVPTLYLDGTRVTGSDVFDVGVGLTKPFAYGTVVSASLAGQRSSRASLEQQTLLGATGPGYSLVGRLAASQPLLRGAGTSIGLASLRQARLNLTANQLAAQATASQVLSQVVSDYWELWYSNEAVRINEASRELARVQQQ